MKSRASIRGHPVHPALAPFPVAFLAGAFLADLAGALNDSPLLWATGALLSVAGIGFALLAAIPGLIDYMTIIPPKSRMKAHATAHMLSNGAALLLFGVALTQRDSMFVEPRTGQLILEGLGTVCLFVGGWLGGELVFRHQIGIEHQFGPQRLPETGRGRRRVLEDTGAELPGVIPGAYAAADARASGTQDRETQNKLDWRSDMYSRDLMTREPAFVTGHDTARRAAELLDENDCGCLPVVDNASHRRVIGVVTDRDIAIRGVARGRSPDTPVRELMTDEVAMVSADDDVGKVERVMSDRQLRRVVVVDGDRRPIGMISQADLALAAGRGDGVDDRALARVVEKISEPASIAD